MYIIVKSCKSVMRPPVIGLKGGSLFEKLLSYIGSVASLISLVLTIYVVIDLSRIKNRFIFRLGAPNLVKELKKNNETLMRYTSDFENSLLPIHEELIKIDVKLRSFEKRLTAESRESVRHLRQAIENYNQDKEQLFTICRCLFRVVEEVKQRQEEMSLGE